ncbi:hypothetical protein RvY_19047 [Ramazzottius varieornatus]|uniref:Uncharacterized protein n=1 Tax=Ramazzottius varieornatus TaxID=947166 RepID=A0A1D1W826_RAMVA|nr:hypothetical protein RvY_19047 [Ramazzottius varieornatus]
MPAEYGFWVVKYRQVLNYVGWIMILLSLTVLSAEISICFLRPLINLSATDPAQVYTCIAPVLAFATGVLTVYTIRHATDGPRQFYRNSVLAVVLSVLSAILMIISFSLFVTAVLGYWATDEDAASTSDPSLISVGVNTNSTSIKEFVVNVLQSTTEIFVASDQPKVAALFGSKETMYGEDVLKHDRNVIYNIKSMALLSEFILILVLLSSAALHYANVKHVGAAVSNRRKYEPAPTQESSITHRMLVDSGPHGQL